MKLGWVWVVSCLFGCGPQIVLDTGTGGDDGTSDSSGSPAEPRPGTGPAPRPGTTADPTPDPVPEPTPVDTTGGPDLPPGTDTGITTSVPETTGTPTTAGDDGGVPGGAGPGATPDGDGDVSLPSADVVAAAVYTDGTFVDFRVQFAAPPFTDEATYDVTWCLDEGIPGGSSCATHATGIDAYLQLFQDGPAGEFVSAEPAVDPCLHGAYESDTQTLRILVPVDEFPGTTDFQWILNVSFGGSFGANEWVPEMGALEVAWVDVLPPFSGEPTC